MNQKIITHSVKFIEIDGNNAGQRIDNFLFNYLKGVPKSHVYKIIRKGEVRVNKGRIKQTYKLQINDSVRIPPVKLVARESRPAPGRSLLNLIEASILFEDAGLMAINKPSGVAVHGGSGVSYGIIEAVRILKPEYKFLELIHRLDKETSGCLLIAKKRSVLIAIQNLLRHRQTDKSYLTLLCGQLSCSEKKIAAPLLRESLKTGERMVRVDKSGKESTSFFSTIEQFNNTSLTAVRIVTGRTHQIRVHARFIGHCVAGDSKYGNYACNQRLKQQGLKRLFLHCAQMSFQYPETDRKISIKAPLPDELEKVLMVLREETVLSAKSKC